MARLAASFIGRGAGKSGKPWARLTPPSRAHRPAISRITDSVNRAALAEVLGRMSAHRTTHLHAGSPLSGRASGSGQLVRPLEPGAGVLAEVLVREPAQGAQDVQAPIR